MGCNSSKQKKEDIKYSLHNDERRKQRLETKLPKTENTNSIEPRQQNSKSFEKNQFGGSSSTQKRGESKDPFDVLVETSKKVTPVNVSSQSKEETFDAFKPLESKQTKWNKFINDDNLDELRTGQNDPNISRKQSVASAGQKRLSKSNTKTWTDEELLSKLKFLDYDTSSNIVRMFDEGSTIPFMCRYRRELIGNLSADE